jgi:hypothetical protein
MGRGLLFLFISWQRKQDWEGIIRTGIHRVSTCTVGMTVLLFAILNILQIIIIIIIRPLLFNICINDLRVYDVINHSNYILFANDLKDYRAIISLSDFTFTVRY